jgi:hypothetical protein
MFGFPLPQYLEENVHKTYVDVDEMTQSLMSRYVEYARRKSVPFKIAVEHGKEFSASGDARMAGR